MPASIVKSPGFLTIDLLWALLFWGQPKNRYAESFLDNFLQPRPIDTKVEFLLTALGFDTSADPFERPGLELPTERLLTICQNGLQLSHKLDVKKFKERQELFSSCYAVGKLTF